jgi:RNA polymerase sigma-70 factor (ECF subfamily)
MKMRSRVIDRLRKGKRRATLLLESQDTLAPTHISEDPALTLERRQLRETIKTLSEHQQEVIELTYFEHMTAVEVGEELGIPTGTVKSRLAAARRALKERLTRDEGGTPQ